MRPNNLLRLWLLITSLILLASAINSQAHKSGKFPSAKSVSVQSCLPDNEISAALQDVSLGQYAEQQHAVALLKADANRSAACRKQVITNLLSTMDQPNLDLTGGTRQFYLWHYGTRLLGELKAVEALDLLIAKLDLDDGTPFPFNHHPAIGGVIDIGEIALPKLQTALRQNPDRYIRRYIVFCIALIGGKAAHQILTQSLRDESDPCVASCIRATVTAFQKNKRRPHNISDESRTNWYATFLCSGQ